MRDHTFIIARKEFLHILRDVRTLSMMIFFPVFFLVLFGYAVSFDVKHVPLAVLDLDRSSESRELVSSFVRSGYFDLYKNLDSASDFAPELDSGRVKLIVNIPTDFSNDIKRGIRTEVQLLLDGTDPTVASSAISYITSITEDYMRGLLSKKMKIKDAINLRTRFWYNENLRSLNFFVPGLICVILMLISAVLTSVIIVSEKEEGTMEKLIVSPIRKYELMVGKILPYALIAFFDILLVIAVGVFLFSVPIKGSLLLLLISAFIFLLGAMAFGLLISVNARSSQEAIMLAMIATLLPTILLSGFVFPIENMPWLLQCLTYIFPARYFMVILRGIFLKGTGIIYLWRELLFMTLLTLLIIFISAREFKKRLE